MSKSVVDLLNFENPVFKTYVFWASILILKLLFMSIFTGIYRFKNKSFVNPEDLPSKKLKVKFDDPDVERVRRAHLNDLENIIPFLIAGLLYICTDPKVFLATTLFRIAALSRIAHTIVYAVVVIPQPARALAFAFTFFITMYMAVQVMLFCLH